MQCENLQTVILRRFLSLGGRSGVISGRSVVVLGPFGGRSRVVRESFGVRSGSFGVVPGLFRVRSGFVRRSFGSCSGFVRKFSKKNRKIKKSTISEIFRVPPLVAFILEIIAS